MPRESIIALDLEGTLISNAVSQFSATGVRPFLDYCFNEFKSVYLYTAVRDELCVPILKLMGRRGDCAGIDAHDPLRSMGSHS